MAVRVPAGQRGEPAGLAAELRALRLACGRPSYATLRRHSALLPQATVSDALAGRVMPRLEFVNAFVQECLANAARNALTIDPALADLDRWRRRWAHARQAVDDGRRATPSTRDGFNGRPAPVRRVGSTDRTEVMPDDAAAIPGAAENARGLLPWQLPNAARHLYGRDDDMAWLDREVLGRDSAGPADGPPGGDVPADARAREDGEGESGGFRPAPVVVLEGMGGVGKTALAVTWGQRRRAHFPDGQLFADLGGFGPGHPADPARVLELFVRSMGAAQQGMPSDLDGLVSLFRSMCAGRKVLVILDNALDPDQVLPLLPASAGAAVVITTRTALTALRVRAEASRRTVCPLDEVDAIALLTRELPLVDTGRLNRLARACGNLPLALRVAASRLADDLRGDLAAVLDRTDSGVAAAANLLQALANPAEPFCDVSVVLSWSMSTSSAAERRALLLLAAAPSGTVDDFEAAALIGLPVSPTRHLLSGLASRHLVERNQPGGWQLHDLVRAWARDEAVRTLGAAQVRDAQRRALGYYLWTADAADRVLLPQRGRAALISTLPRPLSTPRMGGAAEAMSWFDAILPTIGAAMYLALDVDEFGCAATIPHIMMSYLNLRKPWVTWLALCEIGLRAAAHLSDPERIANLHNAIGIARLETGVFDQAVVAFTRAQEEYRRSGNLTGAAMAENNAGNVHRNAGRPEQARQALLRAVQYIPDDPFRRAIVLHNLAEAEIDLQEYDAALKHAGQAIAAAIATSDELGAATTRTTIGRIQALLGRVDIAEAEFGAALRVQRDGGDAIGQATTRKRLGSLLLEQGRAEEAVTQLAEAVRILTELGDPAAGDASALLDRARAGSGSGSVGVR